MTELCEASPSGRFFDTLSGQNCALQFCPLFLSKRKTPPVPTGGV